MQNYLKQWSDFSKNAIVATQKLVDINTDLMVNLTQQQMDMVGVYMVTGNQQVQALSQAKRLPEIMAVQSQGVEEFNKKFFNNVRVTVEMLTDVKKQLTDWVQDNFQQVIAASPVKSVA
jgi:phasin family protein